MVERSPGAVVNIVERYVHRRFERASRSAEQRIGAASGIRWMLSYVFPDHWSFLIGEIALYSFIVLIGTGIYLAIFYTPSGGQVIYNGPYLPLQGAQMSEAYSSVLNISMSVPAGLLIRQTHHWAADVFIAAIVVHLTRILFTGAFRKPRDLNFYIGLTMLMLAIFEGFCGYSLVDDLLSGMGLVIAYGVALSIPGIGAQVGYLFFGKAFPGSSSFFARLELIHILLIPMALAVLITIHLVMIMRQHHSQFPGPGRRERNVVGTPMWPAYAFRTLGLLFAVAGVLLLLGGLVQVNPIWQWGPFHTYLSENGAQPDWYIGWLIGALRLMPNWEPAIGNTTLIPNPFWGGAFFPAGRVRGHVRVAGARAALHPRSPPARSPVPPPRPADSHRARRRVPQLGVHRVRNRSRRSRVLPPAHLVHRHDPLLAHRRVGRAARRVPADAKHLPNAQEARSSPTSDVAGSDRPAACGR